MNYKRIIFFVIILVVAVSALSAVSAYLDSAGITPFSVDTKVNVDGHDFMIPAGYGEDTKEHKDGVYENGYKNYKRTYFNDDVDMIGITIFYSDDGHEMELETFKEADSIEKTISGKHGYLEKSDNSDLYFFTYVEDNKCILLSAPDESMFSKIII